MNSMFDEVQEENGVDVASIVYTKENLFKRAVTLNEEIAKNKADLKQLKEDFTQSGDNPKGLDKDEVKDIMTFAAKYVADGVDKVISQAEMFKAQKEDLLGE